MNRKLKFAITLYVLIMLGYNYYLYVNDSFFKQPHFLISLTQSTLVPLLLTMGILWVIFKFKKNDSKGEEDDERIFVKISAQNGLLEDLAKSDIKPGIWMGWELGYMTPEEYEAHIEKKTRKKKARTKKKRKMRA